MKGFLFFSWVLGLMACYHTYSIVVDMPGTESRLMSLEQAAQEDSSAIYVKGIVMDIDRNEPLSNAVIVFTKQSKGTVIGMITDSSGAFNRRLLPDVYTIEIKFSGKNTFRFQTDTLQRRMLTVSASA